MRVIEYVIMQFTWFNFIDIFCFLNVVFLMLMNATTVALSVTVLYTAYGMWLEDVILYIGRMSKRKSFNEQKLPPGRDTRTGALLSPLARTRPSASRPLECVTVIFLQVATEVLNARCQRQSQWRPGTTTAMAPGVRRRLGLSSSLFLSVRSERVPV